MNPHHDKQLEVRIQRELDALGELSAPPALAKRILQLIEQRNAAPWYRRDWSSWPVGLRLASFLLLLGAFGGVCFGAWEMPRLVTTLETTSNWVSDAQALWHTVSVLGDVIHTFISRLGTGVIVAGITALFLGSAIWIALGTVCFRLALLPTQHKI